MTDRLHITVMLGGPGAEREVSLRSGAAVAAAFRSLGHTVYELDPQTPDWTLPPNTEVVFLALHGVYGEDGTVQRQLEQLKVPYTGCGPEASRLAFDKVAAKERFLHAGVPTARHVVVDAPRTPWPNGWQPPLVVKPVCQGSSVGLRFVRSRDDWAPALEEALRHDSRVLVEEQILGREATVGILDDRALPVVEVRPHTGVYDFASKYTRGATEYFCPADFEPATARRHQEAGLAAFRAVEGRDYARVDLMVRPAGRPVVLEVNTLPGMTETSLLPKAATAAGLSYPALCQRMIELALRRRT